MSEKMEKKDLVLPLMFASAVLAWAPAIINLLTSDEETTAETAPANIASAPDQSPS